MFTFFKTIFSKPVPTQKCSVLIKHMNQDISIFYKGKLLTPNTDYAIDLPDNKGYSEVTFKNIIDPQCLEVQKCYIPYIGKKLVHQPWGYKKFKLVA